MRNKNWLIGALLLGLAFFLAILLVKPIGVSTEFSVVSGVIHSLISPDIIQPDETRESGWSSTNEYYDKSDGKLAASIKNPISYGLIFVLAIPLGAFIGHLTDRLLKRRKTKSPAVVEPDFTEAQVENLTEKTSFISKYLPGFIGGFLFLFGARMADGCTSGHMMSGIMQGSVSGYIFAASVFASAIPVAILIRRFSRKAVK